MIDCIPQMGIWMAFLLQVIQKRCHNSDTDTHTHARTHAHTQISQDENLCQPAIKTVYVFGHLNMLCLATNLKRYERLNYSEHWIGSFLLIQMRYEDNSKCILRKRDDIWSANNCTILSMFYCDMPKFQHSLYLAYTKSAQINKILQSDFCFYGAYLYECGCAFANPLKSWML